MSAMVLYHMQGNRLKGPASQKQVQVLPGKYYDRQTTDLEVAVPTKGNRKFEILLSGEVDLTPKTPSR